MSASAEETERGPSPGGTMTDATVPPEPMGGDAATTAPLPPPAPASREKAKFTARSGDLFEIGAMLFQEAEGILSSSRKKRLKVKMGRKTIAEVPLTAGALGVMASVMAAVALTKLHIEVE